MSMVRWLLGLILMVTVAVVVYLLLVAVGLPRVVAVVVAILASASVEPTSYFRRFILRR
jgi:hypothetical protein